MTTRFIFICLIVVIFSSCCSKWQQANSYSKDTIQTYFDTLVGERIFPIELTDSTYQLAKIQQIYCCLELEKDVLCVVANITCLNIDSTLTDVGYHERCTILSNLNSLHPDIEYHEESKADTEFQIYNQHDTLYYWLQWNPESPTFVDIESSGKWIIGAYHISSTHFPIGELCCGMTYKSVLRIIGIDDYVSKRYKQIVILPPQSVHNMWFYAWNQTNYFDYCVYCEVLSFEDGHLNSVIAGNLLHPSSTILSRYSRN